MIRLMVIGALSASIIFTSVAVVFSKHRTRVLFAEIQSMQKTLIRFEVEWGQLQLELNTLGEHGRVEKYAYGKLGMVIPDESFSVSLFK